MPDWEELREAASAIKNETMLRMPELLRTDGGERH